MANKQQIMSRKEMLDMRSCDVKNGDTFIIKVAAVAGYNNDWSAYMGPLDWPDEKVVEQGEKLGREQAIRLFYVMSGRKYRE